MIFVSFKNTKNKPFLSPDTKNNDKKDGSLNGDDTRKSSKIDEDESTRVVESSRAVGKCRNRKQGGGASLKQASLSAVFPVSMVSGIEPLVPFKDVLNGENDDDNPMFDLAYLGSNSDFVADTPFYSSLIFILGKSGSLKDACDVFEDMPEQGIRRDIVTSNTMISTACAHSKEETALSLLKKMEESSCKPNIQSFWFLACSQEEVNKVMDSAKSTQKSWAKTPLWKKVDLYHKAAAILKEHKVVIAECLVKEIAKLANDAVTEAVRPPTQGVVAALHMVHCFLLAGFPKGLISCVTRNDSEIGDLTMHLGVNCISFTKDPGIAISKKPGMILLQMELGGKNACIVLEDVDLNLVGANIIKGGFSYSGQWCTAVKVVLVIVDALIEKLKVKVAKLSVGPLEDDSHMTPVVSESSANFIEGLVNAANEKGALFCQEYKREGNLIWPLLLDNVRSAMRIAGEEQLRSVVFLFIVWDPGKSNVATTIMQFKCYFTTLRTRLF